MLFNSVHFVLFFPVVVWAFFLLPPRRRWILLLAASYYFYACWRPGYLALIVASTLVDYVAARRMGAQREPAARRRWLWVSLVANLGMLFFFKYFNFFNASLQALFGRFNLLWGVPALDVILPVGISFYTFQTLSYTLDVYWGRREPEAHLGYFALYVSFFPQLVAGPIERSTHLLPQLRAETSFDYARVVSGLQLMLWGFFKKLVIADRLALYVESVYGAPHDHTGLPLWLATYAFAWQIYCDFSAYSDIAIGSAQVLGYDLMQNFRRPYFATSVADFWRRWHISLSTWFRDYLYVPLGGNRVARWRWRLNLMIVFLVSGLWHGANWTFVVWGALHGTYVVVSSWTEGLRARVATLCRAERFPWLLRAFQVLVVFHLVCLAWIFFRARSVSDACWIAAHLFDLRDPLAYLRGLLAPGRAWDRVQLAIGVSAVLVLLAVQVAQSQGSLRERLARQPAWVPGLAALALALGIANFGMFSNPAQFIYFQF